MHAVVAADGHEVRAHASRLLEGLDEGLVLLGRMRGRIEMRGDGADHLVAHAVEQVIVGHVARADDLDPGLVEPALDELFDEGAALPGRHKDEDGVGLGVGRALQERREIRIGEREADRLHDLAASLGEGVLEGGLRVDAGRIVRHHGDDLLDAVLGRPVRHRNGRLREREARAHDIGRRLGDR